MNFNFKEFIKNFSYTLISNLLSLSISMLIVLIIPKIIGIEEYGYWQLYLFYVSYVGFLHLGWTDGVYLREGGKTYEELDKHKLFSQFYLLLFSQVVLGMILIIFSSFMNDQNKKIILYLTILTMVITNTRSFPLFVLQATNRIKEYSYITISDRILYFIFISISIILGARSFSSLIIADITSRIISLILSVIICKDFIFLPVSLFRFDYKEAYKNINAGIMLMLAYIVSLLIVGVIRFGIEKVWDVGTFGKLSLTLSISNLMMIFINALGLIMFPILRRVETEKLSKIYVSVRSILMVVLLGLLILYVPIKELLIIWLPAYAESLNYMVLVFPIFIFEGKTSLLINTYMKTLREERLMLYVNLITLFLSFVVSFISTYLMKNLELTMISIVVLLGFKSILAEIYLTKILKIRLSVDFFIEILLILIFILSGWLLKPWHSFSFYVISYILYLTLNRKRVTKTIRMLKNIIT